MHSVTCLACVMQFKILMKLSLQLCFLLLKIHPSKFCKTLWLEFHIRWLCFEISWDNACTLNICLIFNRCGQSRAWMDIRLSVWIFFIWTTDWFIDLPKIIKWLRHLSKPDSRGDTMVKMLTMIKGVLLIWHWKQPIYSKINIGYGD